MKWSLIAVLIIFIADLWAFSMGKKRYFTQFDDGFIIYEQFDELPTDNLDSDNNDEYEISKRKKRKRLIKNAKSLIGKPYRYGGRTPKGFDCSGFTQYVYNTIGIEIPHGSQLQSKLGKRTKLRKAKPGDLVFFGEKISRRRYKVNHVAMVLSNNNDNLKIIHASSEGIRIDEEKGTNWESYWKERVLFVRRIIH